MVAFLQSVDLMIWIWLGAVILFGVLELATAGLVSIWFVAGALAALAAVSYTHLTLPTSDLV